LAAATDPQPQVLYEKFNAQNLSKKNKNHKVKKNWNKKVNVFLKLESEKMGSFQMYKKS
jgi:hypothetical protein